MIADNADFINAGMGTMVLMDTRDTIPETAWIDKTPFIQKSMKRMSGEDCFFS
jgi:hypothetical protein